MINKNQVIVFVVSFLLVGAFVLSIPEAAFSQILGCCQTEGQCAILSEPDCDASEGEWCQGGTCNEDTDLCECPTCNVTVEKSVNEPENIEFFFEIAIGDGGPTIPFSLPKGDQFSTMFDIPVDGMLDPTTIRELTDQLPDFCEFIDIDCTTSEDAECFDEEGPVIQCRCGSSEDEITCTFINNCNPPQIPTLSQWGKIIMSGVIGLFAVIGIFAMRRRSVES